MPVESDLSISTATLDNDAHTLNLTGVAFGENYYQDISKVEYKHSSDVSWTAVASITGWTDTTANTTLAGRLITVGNYDVRLTNSDGEQTIKTSAFSVSGNWFLLQMKNGVYNSINTQLR